MSRLYNDPRWLALHSSTWTCPSCGDIHRGLFDLVCEQPDAWTPASRRSLSAVDPADTGTLLTPEFCVIGGTQFFLLCDIDMMVLGAPGKVFTTGVWAKLERTDFQRYVETFARGRHGGEGPWAGRLANRLKGYPDTLGLPCAVEPRHDALRPAARIYDAAHPLSDEQRNGITFERILDLYAVNEHDIRAEFLENE